MSAPPVLEGMRVFAQRVSNMDLAARALYLNRGGPWVRAMAPLDAYERALVLRIVGERLTYEADAYRFDVYGR